MSRRLNYMRYHKYNDFWDTLVKDLDAIEKKAKEEELERKWKGGTKIFWTEELESANQRRRIKRDRIRLDAEKKMAAKAALEIRRETLRQLLEKEADMYKKEMNCLEETSFYLTI